MDNSPSPVSSRHQPLDLLRGLLIVLMALDHANFHIAQQHSPGEYWGGPYPSFLSPAHFVTRLVTHLSAPGFFFLLGVGMVLFTSSRRSKGWSDARIRWHFLLRGLVLISLQMLLNLTQAWSVGGKPTLMFYLGVLAALGFTLIISIPLLDINPRILAGIALGLMIGLEVLTPEAARWGSNFDQLAGTVLVYSGGRGEFWSNYPLLAWLETAVLGMVFGKLLIIHGRKVYGWVGWVGLSFLIGFGVLRTLNGFGTIRPLPITDWMSFLNLVKYPPSVAFILLTIGINLILLGVFDTIARRGLPPCSPLLVYGRVPLFLYLAHIYLFRFIGLVFTPNGSGLGLMYALWLAGLAFLYLPARWYGEFKSSQPPGSWVRFF